MLAYAFPACMSTDSVSQLAQSRGLEPLTDGHPPSMALLWHVTTFLFSPGCYLVLALALLPMCRARLALALITSGVCYELALFVFAPSNDFRYSHWSVTCTIVATIITFIDQRAKIARRVSSSPVSV